MNPDTGEHDAAIGNWTVPNAVGSASEEMLVSFNRARDTRILILPAWFDEANRMRRVTLEVMRRLHIQGFDCFLPDMPGCNESLAPLDQQTIIGWRQAAEGAAVAVKATHVLAIRAGALIAPSALPGWHYAPQTGPKLLRGLIRARMIASREAGLDETSDALLALGRSEGLTLAGWPIGPAMIGELEGAEVEAIQSQRVITQAEIGGAGLWLRAEPDEDAEQANTLVSMITSDLKAES